MRRGHSSCAPAPNRIDQRPCDGTRPLRPQEFLLQILHPAKAAIDVDSGPVGRHRAHVVARDLERRWPRPPARPRSLDGTATPRSSAPALRRAVRGRRERMQGCHGRPNAQAPSRAPARTRPPPVAAAVLFAMTARAQFGYSRPPVEPRRPSRTPRRLRRTPRPRGASSRDPSMLRSRVVVLQPCEGACRRSPHRRRADTARRAACRLLPILRRDGSPRATPRAPDR